MKKLITAIVIAIVLLGSTGCDISGKEDEKTNFKPIAKLSGQLVDGVCELSVEALNYSPDARVAKEATGVTEPYFVGGILVFAEDQFHYGNNAKVIEATENSAKLALDPDEVYQVNFMWCLITPEGHSTGIYGVRAEMTGNDAVAIEGYIVYDPDDLYDGPEEYRQCSGGAYEAYVTFNGVDPQADRNEPRTNHLFTPEDTDYTLVKMLPVALPTTVSDKELEADEYVLFDIGDVYTADGLYRYGYAWGSDYIPYDTPLED